MKAVDFIREFGWDEASIALVYCKSTKDGDLHYRNISVNASDLKRYIDAYDLVQSYGSLQECKEHFRMLSDDMKKAIQLVEGVVE